MDTTGLIDKAVALAPTLALAILTLIVGFWLIKRVTKYAVRAIESSGIDNTLSSFLASLISILLKVLLLFSVAGQVGINTTSFIAILGALMVGVGMALNGTIGHFASGVMLMIFKPFKVGDLVTIAEGHTGTVDSINAFNTVLATLDNKRIIIANSNITGNSIINISGQGTVGVEMTFGISYDDDIDQARKVIMEVISNCPFILDDPATGVVVAELADSSVNLATRPFCKSEHFFDTKFYLQEHVKKALDAGGLNMPYPQVDVHMVAS
jgi:small conductance mechanosensitive channel